MGVRTESTAPTPQLSSYRRRLMVGPSPTNGRCGGVGTISKVKGQSRNFHLGPLVNCDHLSVTRCDKHVPKTKKG